ncbi:AAA family ATPase [Stenotrophomonas sp. PS02298]|uniref:AAA family ATPase n=1 Tax=Stenotrophomonas sp. PS02298 TaxID=2991424 RepID=UPI00249C90A5|nr:AAA family ATPase [Stenotrophomonas sp. PS02298]
MLDAATTAATLPTAAEAESTLDVRALVRSLQADDKRLSQAKIAAESGVSSTTLSQWLGGIYGGDNAAIEAKMLRWAETTQAQRAQAATMPAAPDYIETPTCTRVIDALRYAQLAGDMAVVYGSAGLGKTKAIIKYKTMAPNVWHATMTKASANVVTSLEVVVEALGLTPSGGANKLHAAACRRVANTNGLLVVDEAQHLTEAALDQIRAIHDATGIGIALVGNEAVYARMTGGNRAAYLDRLFSRIGKKVRLIRPSQEDVAALLDGWNVRDGKTRTLLSDIASKPGGLRAMGKVLRLANMFAAAEKRAMGYDDVRSAWRELGATE